MYANLVKLPKTRQLGGCKYELLVSHTPRPVAVSQRLTVKTKQEARDHCLMSGVQMWNFI